MFKFARRILALAAVLAIPALALADDSTDAVASSPAYHDLWQGFHAGVEGSDAQGSSNLKASAANNGGGNYFNGPGAYTDVFNQTGDEYAGAGAIAGGLDLGYDAQFQHFVVGLGLGLNNISLNESAGSFVTYNNLYPQFYQSVHTDWSLALRPEIGVTFGKFLIDANAGLSMIHASYYELFNESNDYAEQSITADHMLYAPIFGVGVRYHVTPAWITKLEVAYANYGATKLPDSQIQDEFTGTLFTSRVATSFDLQILTLTLGLDYQF